VLCAVLAALCAPPLLAQRGEEVAATKHNLSTSGRGDVRALTETRICVFCHTPHNAAPASPLWNRELEPRTYLTYSSPTLDASPQQPTGTTKLCLSCHDGTIAPGTVLNPAAGIAMAGAAPPGFGLDLSAHHPVSFAYHDSLPSSELVSPPPEELTFGAGEVVQCTTCHDPHSDRFGKFLVKDHRYSALCTTCHQVPGWEGSAHATSDVSVAGVLPRPPRDWPSWTRLGEWGCQACHTPHEAPTAEHLLLFTATAEEPFSCMSAGCHGDEPGAPHRVAAGSTLVGPGTVSPRPRSDLSAQLRKPSAHRQQPGGFTAAWERGGGARRSGLRDVACADCHNPHALSGRPAEAPYASGLLAGVAGVDRHGSEVAVATFEYEVCFKCHAEGSGDLETVPRVVASTDKRQELDPGNPSFHPVVARSGRTQVPSLGTTLEPSLRTGDLIGCTSCHADDEGGGRGPHGSAYAPILRARYDTAAGGGVESYEAYALCYRCHERSSILGDVSFRRASRPSTPSGGGHSGHLRAGISCAACHDPHGVPAPAAGLGDETGSHTHLVNFDLRVAQPLPGQPYPRFEDEGTFAGSCTLSCHGVEHRASSYR
jgi:predicted CXXCH cytochrome family protein